MKRAGVVLIVLAGLWLSLLLLWPIYIEPGNGDIPCGRPWRADPIEDFLAPACHRAIVHRRVTMLAASGGIGIGVAVVVLARRRQPISSEVTPDRGAV